MTNQELKSIWDWVPSNKLTLHPQKTRYMVFYPPKSTPLPKLMINKVEVQRVSDKAPEKSFKYVGILLDENLNFKEHLWSVHKKIGANIYRIQRGKNFLNKKMNLLMLKGIIKPYLDHANIIWRHCAPTIIKPLEIQIKRVVRLICKIEFNGHTAEAFLANNILNVKSNTILHTAILGYQIWNELAH